MKMKHTQAWTWIELLVVLAIVGVLVALLLNSCSGPLTRASGVKAGDDIHKKITDYISGEGPIAGIGSVIGPAIDQAVERIKGKEGAGEYLAGLCGQILELINNRIRSTPDAREKTRLTEAKRVVEEACQRARDALAATPPPGK
ncbi:MAG: type II secretion system protein [Opitutaceae bacterium]|nr:type II secretion system protein [Opitutaceae bacterium]